MSDVSQRRWPQVLPGNFHSSPTVAAEEIHRWLKFSIPSRALWPGAGSQGSSEAPVFPKPLTSGRPQTTIKSPLLSLWVGLLQSFKAMDKGCDRDSGDHTRKVLSVIIWTKTHKPLKESSFFCKFPHVVPRQSLSISTRDFNSQREIHTSQDQKVTLTHFKCNFRPCRSTGYKRHAPSHKVVPSLSDE